MPGQSDTEKSKGKRARAGYKKEGYGQEPPPPEYPAPPDYGGYEEPPYPAPEPVTPTATLQVLVLARTPGAKDVPLAGVEVSVKGEGFENTQETDRDGVTEWSGLSLGVYEASVEALEGYSLETSTQTADLTHGDGELTFYLDPVLATLNYLAYHDAKRCGDPAGQSCLDNVEFTVISGTWRQTVRTGRSGRGSLQVPPGQLRIEPQKIVTAGARKLRAASRNLTANVGPGEELNVNASYLTGTGDLQLSATYVEEIDGEQQETPLTGVKVYIYRGDRVTPQPFREKVLYHPAPTEISDLEEGNYTLVAKVSKSHWGESLEPFDPEDGLTTVAVASGSSVKVDFRYRQALGKVMGSLLEENSRDGYEGASLLLLLASGGAPLRAETGPEGLFVFPDVPAGCHELTLEDAKLTDEDGRDWVLSHDSPRTQKVTVGPGDTKSLPPLFLVPDEHLLTVHVLGPDDRCIPNVEVDVYDEENNFVGNFAVDEHGEVTIPVPRAGTYSIYPGVHAATGTPRPPATRVYVNQPNTAIVRWGGGGRFGFGGGGGGGQDTVIDVPYPVLTEGAGASGGSWGATSAAAVSPGLAALGPSVEGTIREVLGWRPRMADPKGFLAALNQAFDLKEVQGHTEFTWKQRSYAVQHDLGAVTGAQASIYSRAKVALDQILPLLEGLKPLRPDADEENVEAVRSIVKSEIEELVAELGVEGGPRVARVDTLFELLLGPFQPLLLNVAQIPVASQIGQLQQIFGFQRNRINTVNEEQNFTNFLILVDHTQSLRQSWESQRSIFSRTPGSQPFFGTQLVLVSRSLAVVAESVQEVYLAMDSVFLGAAERQVVELTFPKLPGEPPLFVSELLSWVDQAASEQGPRLLKEGGRAGAVAFLPTLDRLERLVRNSLIPDQPANAVPAGYRTARVQRALQELADHLQETENLVQQI